MKAMELAVAQEDSCCKIPITLIDRGLSDNAAYNNYSGMDRDSWSPNYGA